MHEQLIDNFVWYRCQSAFAIARLPEVPRLSEPKSLQGAGRSIVITYTVYISSHSAICLFMHHHQVSSYATQTLECIHVSRLDSRRACLRNISGVYTRDNHFAESVQWFIAYLGARLVKPATVKYRLVHFFR